MSKTGYLALVVLGLSLVNMQLGGAGGFEKVTATRVLGGPVDVENNDALLGINDSHESIVTDTTGELPLSLPARGINWGKPHPQNAVDIAGRCGAPLYSAYAGQVSSVRAEGWNGGYGNYVDIDHGENIVTRYAHMSKTAVSESQMVAAGEVIGTMGRTGESTGCHVHFEVRGGMKNPFTHE